MNYNRTTLISILSITLFTLCPLLVSGQSFTLEELKEDFEIFQGSLEDYHPGLYWHQEKHTLDSVFNASKSSLENNLNERDFFNELAMLVSQIGCGHTDVSHSRKTMDNELNYFLPIKLHFDTEEAFFVSAYDSTITDISPGDKVLSINGSPLHSIITKLLSLLSGDGVIKTGKYHALNNYFWYINTYHFGSNSTYQIEYQTKSQDTKTCSIKAIGKEKMFELYNKEQALKDQRNLILEYLENNTIAYLKIQSFFDWKEGKKKVNFNKRLEEIFKEVSDKQISKMILDLRDNGGGKEPWRLFAHFHNKPITFASSAQFVYNKNSPYKEYQKLNSAMKFMKRKRVNTFSPGYNKTQKLNDSTYLLPKLFLTKPFKPLLPYFDHKVVIITNGGSFSASALFASQMKNHNKAIFVGEETGGSYFGNTSMSPTYVTLPNTKIQLEIPLVKFDLAVDPHFPLGRGIIPDYPVHITINDILSKTDPQLIKAVQAVNNITQ